MESETIWVNVSCSAIVKSTGLSGSLNSSLTHAWSCNMVHWSLRKYWSIEWGRCSKCWTFNYILSKEASLSVSASFWSEKPGNLSSSQGWTHVFQFPSSLENLNTLLSATDTITCPCGDRLTLFFLRKCLPSIQVGIIIVFQVKNWCLWRSSWLSRQF